MPIPPPPRLDRANTVSAAGGLVESGAGIALQTRRLTERSFYRKFTAATGQSPAQFIEMVRLDAARMLLSQGLPLKAVAVQVGLSPTARQAPQQADFGGKSQLLVISAKTAEL